MWGHIAKAMQSYAELHRSDVRRGNAASNDSFTRAYAQGKCRPNARDVGRRKARQGRRK